jgi:hypothetical protein
MYYNSGRMVVCSCRYARKICGYDQICVFWRCFMIELVHDFGCTLTFHSPGIEPWVLGLLKRFKPSTVLEFRVIEKA